MDCERGEIRCGKRKGKGKKTKAAAIGSGIACSTQFQRGTGLQRWWQQCNTTLTQHTSLFVCGR